MASEEPEPDFQPSANWPNLKLRAHLLKRLRAWFDEHGFLEVETPLLSREIVNDVHLDPFRTTLAPDPRKPNEGGTLWLQTSPEAAMKRLMAAGGDALFQVTRSFRNGERGRLHNPEFTIVEWYRRGDGMEQGVNRLSSLIQALAPWPEVKRTSYAEAFERQLNLNPHVADTTALAHIARTRGLAIPDGFEHADRDAWLNLLLVECIEPHLGVDAPEVLWGYPVTQAALARVRPGKAGEPAVAERFELYWKGVELANGYHELTDPAALRRRSDEANARRASEGKPALPHPSRLLAAMEYGLPDCTGVALGFDRLVMLIAGSNMIDDVIAFPIDRA